MTCILAALVFGLLAALAVTMPYLIAANRARSARLLQEARTEIAEIATDMQRYLREGESTVGNLVHDELYRMMNEAQYRETYITLTAFLRMFSSAERKSTRDYIARLRSELAGSHSGIAKLYERFKVAYAIAFINRHPNYSTIVVFLYLAKFAVTELKELLRQSSLVPSRQGVFAAGAVFWAIGISFAVPQHLSSPTWCPRIPVIHRS